MTDLKAEVRQFWETQSCGEIYAKGATAESRFTAHAHTRYRLEPYIRDFARFQDGTGRDVLEIGVGMGADHVEWARSNPRRLAGVDLTPRAINWTAQRLAALGLSSELQEADAEHLPFPDESFDIVYSWGVLHTTPDTPQAFREAYRVLRKGGVLRAMIYHRPSFVGLMLWARYGLLQGRPQRSLTGIYASHLESPGTKGYTIPEARRLTMQFAAASHRTAISFGDLLDGGVGQQHRGPLLTVAIRLWPRPLIRHMHRLGLYLLIEAMK